MKINEKLVIQFEEHLNPQKLNDSPIPATIVGYGEISSIFQVGDDDSVVYKRMPLFSNRSPAEKYVTQYNAYCQYLKEAGLLLPDDNTLIVEYQGRPVVLYIGQQFLPKECLGHKLIHSLEQSKIEDMFQQIVSCIEKVWEFNEQHKPKIELSIDGQLSNWALTNDGLYFIDTSTPLYKIEKTEQLDPELLLKSAPGFLRWILRLFFLDDVMSRYYDQRLVYIDLAANLHKEQRPDLIPMVLNIVNNALPETDKPLTVEEIDKYYKEDKVIWTLFLAFRRIDRWITTKILRRRYEFILPGKIKR